MRSSTLYKTHENEDCDTLQSLVRYLYAANLGDIRPITIIERSMPTNITQLPTIILKNGTKIEGIADIITYYENLTKTTNLLAKAKKFG